MLSDLAANVIAVISIGFIWFIILPLFLLSKLIVRIIVPPAVLLFSSADRRHLAWPYRWLETWDNDLSGDDGWKTEHITPGSDPLSSWNRIKWLWRNGGHGLNYGIFGVKYDPAFPVGGDRKIGLLVRPDGAWLYHRYVPMFGRYLEVIWGWGIYGPLRGRCKFSFTTRLKRSRQ